MGAVALEQHQPAVGGGHHQPVGSHPGEGPAAVRADRGNGRVGGHHDGRRGAVGGADEDVGPPVERVHPAETTAVG